MGPSPTPGMPGQAVAPGSVASASAQGSGSGSGAEVVADPMLETAAPPSSLKQKAVRGGLWTLLGFGGGQSLRLLSNILLAQVLLKDDFGLMGMVSVVMAGLMMFSDIGIGPAVIQNKRTDAAFLNTAWTIQVVRGVLLWGGAALLAVPVSHFFSEPSLAWVLPVAAATAALQGLQSTNWFSANRNLSVRGMMLIELATVVVQVIVMVVWAYAVDPSVWALVVGGLVSTTFHTALSHTLPGIRNRFALDRKAAGELIRFGKWLFLSTIVTFFAMHLDKLFLGAFMTTGAFGVYYIGQQLANLGPTLAAKVAQLVGFPALSEVHRDRPDDFNRLFLKLRVVSILPMIAMLLLLVLLGPSLFYLLYPTSLWGAGWIVQVLAISGMTSLVNVSYGNAFMAKGNTFFNMVTVSAQVVATAICVSVGYVLAGETGFLLGLAVLQLVKHPFDAWLASHLDCWQPRFDIPALAAIVLLSMLATLGAQALAPTSIQLGTQVRSAAVTLKEQTKQRFGWDTQKPDPAVGTVDDHPESP